MRAAPPFRPRHVVLIVCLAVLAGCRPGTALHGRYNDFRAYYNAYYNAEKKLQEGEETLQSRDQKIDLGRLVELFPTGSASGRGGTFQETVDKSAELLRDRPGSKWADDALLLIGKAYFYQRNFVGAEQKFRETAEAAELRDQPRLGDEARFWLGRTFAASERYDDGVVILQNALAEPGVDRRWRAQIQLALGELYGRAERWDDAAAALRDGVVDVGDSDLAARAYLLIGQVEEAAGRYDEAATAYATAARRAPAYEVEYAARLSEALVLGVDAGRVDEATERIRAMRRDDKNFQQRAEVELAWARIEAASGDRSAARTRFLDVLYDENLAGAPVRGRAHFRLGEYYRDVERNFVRASAHFDSAATALPADPDASVRLSRGAIRDPRRQAETFASVAATSRRMAEIDSLVTLGSLSDEAFAARIEAIEVERRRVYVEEQRRTNQLRANQAFRDEGDPGAAETLQGDALLQTNVAGFLGHRNPASVQAGRIAFEQTWGDRPLVPNWRRRAAVEASAVSSGVGTGGRVASRTLDPSGGGPPPLDLTTVPRTPEKRQVLAVELAELRYELANALFLSLGRADSAVALYRRILEETPAAPVAARARYALAEVEYAAGRLDAATPLFRGVIDADSASTLALAARRRLGIEPPAEPEDRPDLSAEATQRFAAARQAWSDGDPLGAMERFVALAESDPDAPVAPRSFLAAAAAYADFARGDSLLLTAALPDSLAPALFRDPFEAAHEAETAPGDETASADLPPDADRTPESDPIDRADDGPVLRAPREETPDDADRELIDEERIVPEGADRELIDNERRRPTSRAIESRDEDEERPRRTDPVDRVDDVPAPLDSALTAQPFERAPVTPTPVEPGLAEPAPAEPTPAEPAPADSLRLDVPSDAAPAPGSPQTTSPEALPADSAAAAVSAGAPRGAASDTLAVGSTAAAPGFTLADFLDAIAERYPNTLEAERAESLSAALPRAAPPAVVPAPISPPVSAPPSSAEDSVRVAEAPVPGRPAPRPTDLDANPFGTYGETPILPEAGGFSRRTNRLADAVEASTLARELVEQGYRVAVATDGVDVFVIVGQYPTDKALAIASSELPAAALGAGTGNVEIGDVEILPLSAPSPDQEGAGEGGDGR